MIHWREMGTQGRIDAIRSVWSPGCSSAMIAANFSDVSRNAIIGIYARYGRTHLADTPLRSPILAFGSRKPKQRTYAVKVPAMQAPRPSAPEMTEHHLAGKPMMMLEAKECRFPVNDAVGEELHLFCARPAERSYCAFHAGKSYRVTR